MYAIYTHIYTIVFFRFRFFFLVQDIVFNVAKRLFALLDIFS